MKRIQIGAVLVAGVALVATGCSPVGDASGPDWFVVPDRFTDGLPDASVGSDPDASVAPNGGSGGSAGSANGGSGGSTLGDAGLEPSDAGELGDGGPLAPFGIGDPWFFDAPEELSAFQVSDHLIISTHAWRAGDGEADGGQVGVASGHIEITAPFTAPNQTVQFRITLPHLADFTGRTLKVRVKRSPGTGQGGVHGFVQSGEGMIWVSGVWNPLSTLTELTDVTLDFDTATDPKLVKRFGIQLHSGTEGGNIETVQIAVDDFRLE